MSTRDELDAYQALRTEHGAPAWARAAHRALPPSGRLWVKQTATRAMSPAVRRRAGSLSKQGLRLHLGCGGTHLDGWTNIDLAGTGAADLVWDLRQPLPFEDGSADAVFLEHVFEHMTYPDVVQVLEHVHRVLRPGGAVRVGVPDAGLYARAYVEDRPLLGVLRAGRPTPMLAMREVFQEHGHLSAYDAETLVWVMRAAGFDDAAAVEANTSAYWADVPDSESRVAETVYAEARR